MKPLLSFVIVLLALDIFSRLAQTQPPAPTYSVCDPKTTSAGCVMIARFDATGYHWVFATPVVTATPAPIIPANIPGAVGTASLAGLPVADLGGGFSLKVGLANSNGTIGQWNLSSPAIVAGRSGSITVDNTKDPIEIDINPIAVAQWVKPANITVPNPSGGGQALLATDGQGNMIIARPQLLIGPSALGTWMAFQRVYTGNLASDLSVYTFH